MRVLIGPNVFRILLKLPRRVYIATSLDIMRMGLRAASMPKSLVNEEFKTLRTGTPSLKIDARHWLNNC
jgi:hypothetical protein